MGIYSSNLQFRVGTDGSNLTRLKRFLNGTRTLKVCCSVLSEHTEPRFGGSSVGGGARVSRLHESA